MRYSQHEIFTDFSTDMDRKMIYLGNSKETCMTTARFELHLWDGLIIGSKPNCTKKALEGNCTGDTNCII